VPARLRANRNLSDASLERLHSVSVSINPVMSSSDAVDLEWCLIKLKADGTLARFGFTISAERILFLIEVSFQSSNTVKMTFLKLGGAYDTFYLSYTFTW